MATENCVVQLNEYVQRTRSELRYEDVVSVGPDHIKTFTIRAVLNGKVYPDGQGKNKKEAKQNAAKNALGGLLEESTNCTENAVEASSTPVHQTSIPNINYVCWLNEYGLKNRVLIKAVEATRLGSSNATHFVVGDKEYPTAYGKTRREAKEEAAKLVYHEVCGSKTTESGGEKHSGTSSPPEEESNPNVSEICDKTKGLKLKTEGGSFTETKKLETNFIGAVNHYCQTAKYPHDYILERRCGPPHSPQFFYKLVINKKEYAVGEGKNVKEAKQNAAQLAWAALQEQPDWHSKFNFFAAVSDDGSPARMPPPPITPGSRDAQSKNMQTPKSHSRPKDQVRSPDVKPRIRLAANFQNAPRNSKEDLIVNFNGKNTGSSPSENTTAQSVISRFTSEFDSIERLGKGAFGRVFMAKQKLLDKFYAVKIVRCKEKALREVGALSDLHHCNIVRYYTCWMEDSEYQWDITADSSSASQSTSNLPVKYLYIQMELCDTKTLRVWIDEKNIQNVKKSLRDSKRRDDGLSVAQQLVSGVEYIHSKMLIHRDLKPANIMFGRDGEVKIGDFGLVTAENDDDAENLIERTVYKGTPSYMAPEQRNRSTYDRKVDIFALGLIYFELLWNLSGDRKAVWDDARTQKLPQGFSHNFPQESQIIKSMLREKPEERPEASKLKTDLAECAQTLVTLKNRCRESKTV